MICVPLLAIIPGLAVFVSGEIFLPPGFVIPFTTNLDLVPDMHEMSLNVLMRNLD